MPFTTQEKIQCLEHELASRRQIYRNRVETGRMNAAKAFQYLDCLKEIIEEYRKLEQQERLL